MKIYRKKMTMSVNLIPATFKTSKKGTDYVDKAGAAMIMMLPAKTDGVYDESNKITFAISENDLPALFEFFAKARFNEACDIRLVHDPNKGKQNSGNSIIKTFAMSKIYENGAYKGFGISITVTTNGQQNSKISTGLSFGEFLMFEKYINALFPKIMGLERNVEDILNKLGMAAA